MTSILDPNLAAVTGPSPPEADSRNRRCLTLSTPSESTVRSSSPPGSGSSVSSASPRASRATSRCATRNTPSISG